MPQTGSLTVRAFTSQAQLPVPGATVIISGPSEDGRRNVLSIQTTDSSGTTKPVQLAATFEQLQVFPGVETVQNVPLMPLPQPASGDGDAASPVVVTPQPL